MKFLKGVLAGCIAALIYLLFTALVAAIQGDFVQFDSFFAFTSYNSLSPFGTALVRLWPYDLGDPPPPVFLSMWGMAHVANTLIIGAVGGALWSLGSYWNRR